MTEKHIYNLKVDEQFKQLIPPLTDNEQKQLEENLVNDGCRDPLCVWEDIIIDGHNRYEICTRLGFPFSLQKMYFNNREEVIAWICANQLGRRNISEETRRYLIGKRYEIEKNFGIKNPSGRNQYSENEAKTVISNFKASESKGLTAERIGNEYNIARATVRKYAHYAKTIDNLAKKDPELIPKVLTGRVKISYDKIAELSKKDSKTVSNVNSKLIDNNSNFISYSDSRKIIPQKKEKITVKDMPAYDPDSEISSLAFTVPSWISSINRVLSVTDFDKVSDSAKRKLQDELKNLDFTANAMLLAIEEKL